jgi:uncharacterized protein YoxC
MTSAPSSSQNDGLDSFREWTPRSSPAPKPVPDWATPGPSNIQQSEKRSIGRRMARALARYSVVFLIGIGTTLAWQSYGDEAMEIARTEVPSLAWLLPVSTAKPPPDDQASATAVVPSSDLVQQLKPMAVDLDIVRRSVQQLANKVEQLAAPSSDLVQQLKPMAVDLDIVRRSVQQLANKVEQLAAKQDQMSQNITTLQAVEQEVSEKLSALPQSQAVPPRKPSQPTGR